MKLYTDKSAISACSDIHLLLDNDFLSELYKDEEVLIEFLNSFRKSFFIIDPLTEFEFLRDVFDPEQRRIKEAFVDKPIFQSIPNNQEIFIKLQENALLLSKMYSHKGHNKNTKISLVDLFLGARAMLNPDLIMTITGNKKDFPNSTFDTVAVLNIEQGEGSMKPYSVVQFNKSKFDSCFEDLNRMEKEYKKNNSK